jgi:hypothetical protein
MSDDETEIDWCLVDRGEDDWLVKAVVLEDGGHYTGQLPAVVDELFRKHGANGVNAVWCVIQQWGSPPREAITVILARYLGFFYDLAEYARHLREDSMKQALSASADFKDVDVEVFASYYDWDGYGISLDEEGEIETIDDDDGVHVLRGEDVEAPVD